MKIVTIERKDKEIIIENVNFVSLERNFVVVNYEGGKRSFKNSVVLSMDEVDIKDIS